MNIISGIGALFFVVFVLMMKESDNKTIGYIGLGIIAVARLTVGAEGISESTAILLIVGIIIIAVAIQLFKTRKERVFYEAFEKEYENRKAQEEIEMIQRKQELLIELMKERSNYRAIAEEEYNSKISHLNLLLSQNKISVENYEKGKKGIEEKYLRTLNS